MATNPDDALENIANAPDLGGEDVAPVDIELTDDDMGGETLADYVEGLNDTPPAADSIVGTEGDDTPPPAEEPAPRPRQPRANVRIAELSERATAAEAERDALREQATVAAQQRAEAEHAAIFHYHGKLTTEAASLKAQLAAAKRDGDTDNEIDLQTRLNVVTIEMNGAAEALQMAPPRAAPPAEPPRPAPAAAPAPPQAPALPPETAAWIGRNSWFQQGSADFDNDMYTEARLYANKVERRYAAEGKPAAIGSQAYFMEIDRHLRTEFPDAYDDPAPAPRGVPPMSRDATVAPVQRGGAPAPGALSGRTVRLSAEERSFAHGMASNGAWNKPDGSRPTPAEAERMYAAQILRTQKS